MSGDGISPAAAVEGALASHEKVAEAAVVAMAQGGGLYAYVTLREGVGESDALREELVRYAGEKAGTRPETIQFAPALPKTRAGKLVRRLLRKIADDDPSAIGEASSLADSRVVRKLIDGKR
jgi:acetyl-CoA synthetase